MSLPADQSRPVVLFVQTVIKDPDITPYQDTERVSVIDLEITMLQSADLAKYLQERVDAGHGGAVRVRFMGRLIHL